MENQVQFYQYETVDLTIKLPQDTEVLDHYDEIVVSIAQSNTVINVSQFSVSTDPPTIMAHLSQTDTGKLKKGKATLQVNIYEQGQRKATGYGYMTVLENLYKKVMGNG